MLPHPTAYDKLKWLTRFRFRRIITEITEVKYTVNMSDVQVLYLREVYVLYLDNLSDLATYLVVLLCSWHYSGNLQETSLKQSNHLQYVFYFFS